MKVETEQYKGRRICVAPMMDWTDRHCRYFHRLLTRHTWLYTEMVSTGALLHGDVARHLHYHQAEHPIALQLGGSQPHELARCAKLAAAWCYDEINLNCGCPSPRVARGAFGACLMAEPTLVADCIRAMRDAVSIPVTVKHRIGLDKINTYAFVHDFVATVADAGCQTFIVHARNAILKTLNPKQNRQIPPLNYDYVYRLKRDFPQLEIIINGGIKTPEQITHHLSYVDGVMLGREAYRDPWLLAEMDRCFYDASLPAPNRAEVTAALAAYAAQELAHGADLGAITRHTLGLYRNMNGAAGWRRVLSDHRKLAASDPHGLFNEALNFVVETGRADSCLQLNRETL